MEILNRPEPWQTAIGKSSDTDTEESKRKCKKMNFLVNDTTLLLDNSLRFDLVKRIEIKKIKMIRDEKLRYDANRKAAKISALSSGTIDKSESRTGEYIYFLIKVK